MIKKTLLLIIFIIVILTPVLAEAQNTAVKEIREMSTIGRLQEKIALFFKFSSKDKARYQKELIEKRFAELQYIIDNGQGDLIEEASSRYATYVGKFSDYLLAKKLAEEKEEYLKILASHSPVLENLRDYFPSNSGFWLLLQHDINTVQIYSDKLKNLK